MLSKTEYLFHIHINQGCIAGTEQRELFFSYQTKKQLGVLRGMMSVNSLQISTLYLRS